MTRRVRAVTADRGSVMLLTIGLSAVLLLLVAVVVDVSAVVLSKRALVNAADGAAIAAAQQPDREAISRSETALDERLPLDVDLVDEVVATYASDAQSGQPGLVLQSSVDGGTVAVVDAYRTVRLPFSGWLGVLRVDLHAVGRAQSPTTP